MKHFISIAVSTKKFEDKPSKTDWPSMVYTNRTVDFMSFLMLIKQGYVFTNIHSLNGTFTANEKKTTDRKSTRLNSSHANISYAVFCLKKKTRHLWMIASGA